MIADSKARPRVGFLSKLKARVNRGTAWLTNDLPGFAGRGLDPETIEELETRLLSADVGVPATAWLVDRMQRSRPAGGAVESLRAIALELLSSVEAPLHIPAAQKPFVILVVGVNGTGKTTTIGKLAHRLRSARHTVLLGAADTFRAAAVEQLEEWGARAGAPIVAQAPGADPAAVVHDALQAARARGLDVVIADTAGRLHTSGLMDELEKIKRVAARFDAAAPHEILLVLDASQGQNALVQARRFHERLGVTGLVITKLDGTAKGGILLGIARELAIPIRFVAVGEDLDDLDEFRAAEFVEALIGEPGS